MPFKSIKQRKLFYHKAKKGQISWAKVKEWEDETKGSGALPKYARKHRRKKGTTWTRKPK